jgi:hypothetical protein
MLEEECRPTNIGPPPIAAASKQSVARQTKGDNYALGIGPACSVTRRYDRIAKFYSRSEVRVK